MEGTENASRFFSIRIWVFLNEQSGAGKSHSLTGHLASERIGVPYNSGTALASVQR